MIDYSKLFRPALIEDSSFGRNIRDVFIRLGKDEQLPNYPIKVCKIPYVLRTLGIPSGMIEIESSYIAHIVGLGEKEETKSSHYHDITLKELCDLPYFMSDPDMIFRSNTHPNSSVIVCNVLEKCDNPIVVASRLEIKTELNCTVKILSCYEKDRSPEQYFSDLYSNGYCLYSKESNSTEKVFGKKLEAGVRDQPSGPIPGGAVTCTASSTFKVLTQNDIVNKYILNQKEMIAVFGYTEELGLLTKQNLDGLGYKTVLCNQSSIKNINNFLKESTAIAFSRREDEVRFHQFMEVFPNIKNVQLGIDFMPTPIFAQKLPTLAEIRNRKESIKGKQR